jgi:hypothetical protein
VCHRHLRKIRIAFPSIDAKHIVFCVVDTAATAAAALLFKGCFAMFPNIAESIGTVAKELFVSVLVLESKNTFASVVAFVTILVGAGFVLSIA